jgi:hypothetical protein
MSMGFFLVLAIPGHVPHPRTVVDRGDRATSVSLMPST